MSQFPEESLSAPPSDGGGYFPAYPNLKLDGGRYEIVYKLGFGPRSSVWLAKDTLHPGCIALKILTTYASKRTTQELEVLQYIKSKKLEELPLLKCQFTASSPHGEHVCFGLGVLGGSVEALRLSSPTKTLPTHVVQKAIGSMILPLDALHRNSVIHGAVTPENMLFYAGEISDNTDAQIAKLPPCTIENKMVVNGVEYPVIRSHPLNHGYKWDEPKEMLAHASITLTNVAHAHIVKVGTQPTWSGTDIALRPPEIILETSFDTKVDVWMLGAAAFILLTGEPLVPPEKTRDEADQLGWLQAMARDAIKCDIALSCSDLVRRCFFDDEGMFVDIIPDDSITNRLAKIPNLTPEEKQGAADFIEQCISLDPVDRPSIDDLRYHPWLQPGYACSCGYCG